MKAKKSPAKRAQSSQAKTPAKAAKTFSKQNPLRVTINRKLWGRGGEGWSGLLSADTGKMCCLGFVCRKLGFKAKDIKWVEMPSGLEQPPLGMTKKVDGIYDDIAMCKDLAGVNDDCTINDSAREEKVIAGGAKIGLAFRFVG